MTTWVRLAHLAACALSSIACAGAPSSDEGLHDPSPPEGDGGPSDAAPAPPAPSTDASPTDGSSADAAPIDDGAMETSSGEASPHTVLLVPGTLIDGSYFDTMAARLRADGFDPVVFVPPDMFTDSLALGAQRIDDEVKSVLSRSGESRLHVVAECDGGVATRYWVELLGGDRFVDQVVTFVSAHHGTAMSPIGSWTTGYQALADITPGSDFLAKLNGAPLPAGLHFTSIYSCHDELMVPYDTSVVDGATNVLFCDHWISHLDGFWDALVYERILATLRHHGDAAPTRY